MALQTCFHSSYPAELRVSPLFSMSPDIILYYSMEIYNHPKHCFGVCEIKGHVKQTFKTVENVCHSRVVKPLM